MWIFDLNLRFGETEILKGFNQHYILMSQSSNWCHYFLLIILQSVLATSFQRLFSKNHLYLALKIFDRSCSFFPYVAHSFVVESSHCSSSHKLL